MVDTKAEAYEILARLIRNEAHLPILFVILLKGEKLKLEFPLAVRVEAFDIDMVEAILNSQRIPLGLFSSFICLKHKVMLLVDLRIKSIDLYSRISIGYLLRRVREGRFRLFARPSSCRRRYRAVLVHRLPKLLQILCNIWLQLDFQ